MKSSDAKDTSRILMKNDLHNASFDARRCQLMRCQILQLERQLLLLSNSISSRRGHLLEIKSYLLNLITSLSKDINSTQQPASAQIVLSRAVAIETVEKAHKLLASLDKSVTLGDGANECAPELCNTFVTTAPVKCNEIRLSSLLRPEYGLHAGAITQLESQLAHLHAKLSLLSRNTDLLEKSLLLPEPIVVRYSSLLAKTTSLIDDCSTKLLELSFIIPSRSEEKKVAVDQAGDSKVSPFHPMKIRRCLQDVKNEKSKLLLEGEMKRLNLESERLQESIALLKEELEYYHSRQHTNAKYARVIISGLKKGYDKMKSSFTEEVLQPCRVMLEAHERLQKDPSNAVLKEFLEACRVHMPVLQLAVDTAENELFTSRSREEDIFAKFERAFLKEVKSLSDRTH